MIGEVSGAHLIQGSPSYCTTGLSPLAAHTGFVLFLLGVMNGSPLKKKIAGRLYYFSGNKDAGKIKRTHSQKMVSENL